MDANNIAHHQGMPWTQPRPVHLHPGYRPKKGAICEAAHSTVEPTWPMATAPASAEDGAE